MTTENFNKAKDIIEKLSDVEVLLSDAEMCFTLHQLLSLMSLDSFIANDKYFGKMVMHSIITNLKLLKSSLEAEFSNL